MARKSNGAKAATTSAATDQMLNDGNCIYIKGARVNNLKNIDVAIPRDKLVVITGLSGSGKSSLAFDTLYAEGQRRYVESLSSYARQFLGRMGKPECDYILGIPPAVAIQQKVIVRNPRSTVGTSTEIYDYLRLLFARVGKTYSPRSGTLVKKHTTADVVAAAQSQPDGSRICIYVNATVPEGRSLSEHVDVLRKNGFARAEVDGRFVKLEDLDEAKLSVATSGQQLSDRTQKATSPHRKAAVAFHLVVDRMKVPFDDAAAMSRFADSVETAFYEGDGECCLKIWLPDGGESAGGNGKANPSDSSGAANDNTIELTFSKRFEADGMTFDEPSDLMFNFNSPVGACPTCEGFGRVMGIDENLVIPNKALSVYEDCVVCWKGEKMSEWKRYFIEQQAPKGFPIHKPYYQLTEAEKDILWHSEGEWVASIDNFFRMVNQNLYKIQYRVMLSRYRGKTTCPTCGGSRLKTEAGYVKVGGRSITELVRMTVGELIAFFDALALDDHDAAIAKRLLTEIRNRLGFLRDVGLSYLTLDRLSNSLSGGESQRINLATALGSALVGSMYILDEPSIGLHPRDTDQLIGVLRQLRDQGNTVIVVEHDEEIIRSADYLIDIGPEAGRFGGEVVWQGETGELKMENGEWRIANDADHQTIGVNSQSSTLNSQLNRSHTARFLAGLDTIPVPVAPRPWSSYIEVRGAVEHNLKGIDVRFPLGVLTVVTGVSGSGKSTLVRELLYKGLLRHLGEPGDAPGAYGGLAGDWKRVAHVEFVDQNPIGKSSRSNAATYLKAYDEIRRVYAEQPLARQLGFTAATFSFNVEGGRCEECKGDGTITVEMQFMADLTMPCEACHGRRFKSDVLEVKYKGRDIAEVLDMSVDEAIEFFADEPRVTSRLIPLQTVGLGYIKLGQSSSTLSGGENQRVKLAYYLQGGDETHGRSDDKTLFIFDEPTTGLHLHDVAVLLRAFDSLVARGHTIVVIEHNLDVIKCADHIVDLGPEGGADGGRLVYQGTPRGLLGCEGSYTARYLAPKFDEASVALLA